MPFVVSSLIFGLFLSAPLFLYSSLWKFIEPPIWSCESFFSINTCGEYPGLTLLIHLVFVSIFTVTVAMLFIKFQKFEVLFITVHKVVYICYATFCFIIPILMHQVAYVGEKFHFENADILVLFQAIIFVFSYLMFLDGVFVLKMLWVTRNLSTETDN